MNNNIDHYNNILNSSNINYDYDNLINSNIIFDTIDDNIILDNIYNNTNSNIKIIVKYI